MVWNESEDGEGFQEDSPSPAEQGKWDVSWWYNPKQTSGNLGFVFPALLCGVSSPFLSPGLKFPTYKKGKGAVRQGGSRIA